MTQPLYTEDQAASDFAGLLNDDFEIPHNAGPPTPVEEPKPPAAPEEEEPETPDEPAEAEVEETEAETDEPEAEEPTEPEDDQQQPTAIEVHTLSDLAENLEMSADDLLALRHEFKASGETFDLPVRDIVKMAQEGVDATKKRQEAAEVRRTYEQREAERAQAREAEHRELAQQFAALKRLKAAQLESDEMRQLEEMDPARAVLRQRDIQRELAEVDQAIMANAQHYEQQRQQAQQEYLQREFEALQQAVPDWGKDAAIQVATVLRDYGFRDEEIGQASDHRFVKMVHELATLKAKLPTLEQQAAKTKEAAAAAAKKVKKSPVKLPKGKAPASEAVKLSAARARQFKKFKASGSPEDAAPLLASLID